MLLKKSKGDSFLNPLFPLCQRVINVMTTLLSNEDMK